MASFPLLGQKIPCSTHPHHLLFFKPQPYPFFLRVIHGNTWKTVVITPGRRWRCCYVFWYDMIYQSSFKGDMFTCRADSKKENVRHPRICPFRLPSCAQMFPGWRTAGNARPVPVVFHFSSRTADSGPLLRGTSSVRTSL